MSNDTSESKHMIAITCAAIAYLISFPCCAVELALERSWVGHTARVTKVAFLTSDRFLSASDDGTIAVWTVGKQQPDVRLKCLAGISSFVVSRDRSVLIAGSVEGMELWDLQKRTRIGGFPDGVGCLCLAPDGKSVVDGGGSKSGTLWDIASKRTVLRFTPPPRSFDGGYVCSIAAAEAAPMVAFGLLDSTIEVYDTRNGKMLKRLGTAASPAFAYASMHGVGLSADGAVLVGASNLGNLHFWDTKSWAETSRVECGGSLLGVAFSPDSARVAVVNSSMLEIWSTERRTRLALTDDASSSNGKGTPRTVAFSPMGTTLVTGDTLGGIKLWTLSKIDSK